MTTNEAARLDLFLTIGIPLLPVFWIVPALQTTWLRTQLGSATVRWLRNGGGRRSHGNVRASLWAAIAATCFVTGGCAEAFALAAILFGSRAMEKLAATFLLFPLSLAIGLSAWALLLQVATGVDVETESQ